jgi:hypothetical protein
MYFCRYLYSGQFYKHFKSVTYTRSKIGWSVLKTQYGRLREVDGAAYFPTSISYKFKMFMKLTTDFFSAYKSVATIKPAAV